MKRNIALFFATLLLWTVAMSVIRVVFDQELNATNLGVIIFVGAIVVFATFLAGHIAKIRQSEIARFFTFVLPWMSGMVFSRFISGQLLNATIIGVTVSLGAIFGLIVVIAIHISEKSRR